VDGTISSLATKERNLITSVERGIWALTQSGGSQDAESPPRIERVSHKDGPHEEDFYQPFADWLIEHEVCTSASPLGGKQLPGKWGTPDTVGIERVSERYLYRSNNIISFVSAEVKISQNGRDIIEAFGQACAYLHFSHKVYLVLPRGISLSDDKRIRSLCGLIGLGLVFFDPARKKKPDFQSILQPVAREPDVFALNNTLGQEAIYKRLIETRRT
jgi:hypothetical protein